MKLDYITDTSATEEIDIVVSIDNNGIETGYPQLKEQVSREEMVYSSTTLTTASVLTAFIALFVGFLIGYLTSRKCNRDNYKSCGHHYLETQQSINK